MRKRLAQLATTALCLTVVGGSDSQAQDIEQQEIEQGANPSDYQETEAPRVVPPSPQAERQLTAEQQIAAAEAVVTRGANLSKRVRALLNEARKANDIIKTTCLNDKLAQINANLRNAEQRLEEFRKAANPERRSHEYTVIMVLGQKLEVLDQEAGQCIGEDLYETGATNVTTEINESLVPMGETPSMPPLVSPASLPHIPPPESPVD